MRTFSSFQGVHRGESIIVCGCGESLNDFAHPERFITIGVNDVGRRFQPNYLLVVDPKGRIKEDRFHYVETSQAEYLFTQHENLGVPHPNIVKFGLYKKEGPDFSDPNSMHYTTLPLPSTYFALCLAVHMGARRIGLIGMDFTDNHFFGKTGKPLLAPYLAPINEQFLRLSYALQELGIEVFNLSPKSLITAFPKMPLAEFGARYSPSEPAIKPTTPLRIVSYSTTPVRGVPAILSRCINGGTPHSCRCIWGWNRYATGAVFEGDLNWNESPTEAETVLREADVVIVHAGKIEQRHQPLLAGKAILTMAHSYLRIVDPTFVKQGFPGVVVGQSWATLSEFKNWNVVPNPFPLWERVYQPSRKNGPVTICYTPAVKLDCYSSDNPQYLFSKGYSETMRILEKLATQFPIQLEIIPGRHLPHVEVLEMKRRAHIVIDECVTGGYHRNSLEGLAAGCVVVNSVGLLPEVTEILHYCTGGQNGNPFVFASMDILQGILTSLIERGTDNLVEEGKSNRQWMERYWGFAWQWRRFWMPVINQALDHVASRRRCRC
jgi:hypothetical protein